VNYSYSIVVRVDLRKTSSTCAVCGRATTECAERKVWCDQCRTLVDRDVNGARNILARGMRFVPIALLGEGMKQSKDADSMAAELTQRL
jgi:transposase